MFEFIVLAIAALWALVFIRSIPRQRALLECVFKPGDKVTAFGNTGTVKRISPNAMYVEVLFPEFDSVVTFHLDGKQSQWHKLPSLRKL